MLKFNTTKTLLMTAVFFLSGCLDDDPNKQDIPTQSSFFDLSLSANKQIQFSSQHTLTLTRSPIEWRIDESGFEPKLLASFKLKVEDESEWPMLWVAFNVNLAIKDKPLAKIARTGVMNNQELKVQIRQNLPRFGLDIDQLKLTIQPIAWMPAFPLQIK